MNRLRALALDWVRRLSGAPGLGWLRPTLLGIAYRPWVKIERFEPSWLERIDMMARHIPVGASVVDLGCGPMWLKSRRPDIQYLGVDYADRGPGTVVADFNNGDLPNVSAQFAFVSGCLEYIRDTDSFVSQICKRFENCVLSYCSTDDAPDLFERRRVGWVNDLSAAQLISSFSKHGFHLVSREARTGEQVFVFSLTS